MFLERKQELSIYYWLEDIFSGDGVSIVDAYYNGELQVPRIAIDPGNIESYTFELGGQEGYDRIWYLRIFGNTKQQRDEMGYKIFNTLRNKRTISVYDYDEGFPPSVTPTEIGYLSIPQHQYRPENLVSELQEILFYRAAVAIHSKYIV